LRMSDPKKHAVDYVDSPCLFMHSPPSQGSRPTHVPLPPTSQPFLSPTFVQSPSGPAPSFPIPFPTPQYGYTPSTSLAAPNWQRPRATSSYASESPTLAFPEPQLHRATSARAIPRPSSPLPRTPGRNSGTSPLTPPALPPRSSPSLRTPGTEVLSEQFHFK
jgi:hypothetical protein